jgi:hypothetical protein
MHYNQLVVTYFNSISLYSIIIFYFISLQHIFYDSTFNLFPNPSQYTMVPATACQNHQHYMTTHPVLSLSSMPVPINMPYLPAQLLFFA